MKKIYVVILAFSLFSCRSNRGNDIRPIQQRLENYNGSIAFPVEERILTTPVTILNLLNQLDNVDYSSYELNTDEKQLFMDYFDMLPLVYKYIIIEKVIGIYFINDFARSGMTEPVYDDYGNMYTVIFLNPEILYQNLPEWINYKDNSIFEDNDSKISVIIECDNTYQAIFCVLLHETCHVYDFINHVTSPLSGETTLHTDFTNGIWNDYNEPIERFDFANRQNMVFYDTGNKINKEYALDMYTALSHTPFSSLYGSTTWIEDFAESFTWYYLNKYHDIKYVTHIMENEITLLSYDPNENELVKRRYGIFEEILE
jgi:hypothetical protein